MLESRTSKLWAAFAAVTGFALGAWTVMGTFKAHEEPWHRARAEELTAVLFVCAALLLLVAAISHARDVFGRHPEQPPERKIITLRADAPVHLDRCIARLQGLWIINPTDRAASLTFRLVCTAGMLGKVVMKGETFLAGDKAVAVAPNSTTQLDLDFDLPVVAEGVFLTDEDIDADTLQLHCTDLLSRAEMPPMPLPGKGAIDVAPKQKRAR